MDVPRSEPMILVAYFLARWAERPAEGWASNPPRELTVGSWAAAFRACHARLGDGRPLGTFANSIQGQVRAFTEALRDGRPLPPSRQAVVSPWARRSREDLWAEVRRYFEADSSGDRGVRLAADVADDEPDMGDAGEGVYTPVSGDRRAVVERQIRVRRGQQAFRDALRKRYGDRCEVTGCLALAVLEAAHINPYRGEGDNHPANGLLLRADVHTLFDLDLLGIAPDTLRVELHPGVVGDYGSLEGRRLDCRPGAEPSAVALAARYRLFLDRCGRPV